MSLNDLKLYGLNSLAMAISFSNVESTLKIFLLCVSIIYTIMKTIELMKKKNDERLDLVKQAKKQFPNAIVQGHKDFKGVAKACPSFDAKSEYKDI